MHSCTYFQTSHLVFRFIEYTMPTGTLEVIIVEGRRLKDKDAVGQSDPYIEIYTHKKYKQRTTTIQNTNDPVWNERFTFNIHPDDDTIHFDVYDSDVGGKDSIGNGKVKLKSVFDDGKFDDWVKLPAHLGLSVHGEIHVIMNFTVSYSLKITFITRNSSILLIFSHRKFQSEKQTDNYHSISALFYFS
jgi:Ca2+-dependent lipid-binding protein